MATITTSAYNDAAARTAGEAMTINSGAVWTIRTDTRVHANAPASNTGSLGSVTINEGELVWDSTNIRWMPFDSGTGNVPAIGTSITQGAVSGYLLGVWASITVVPTAAGAAMPTSGFIKFREVTGGSFSSGALSGIGASATGPDVQGWMEIVHDAASNITVPRLGKHTVRGGRFFLDNTTGVRGQQFQIPTMGSAVQGSPGLYVETGVNTNEYEFWPALDGAAGWATTHLCCAAGTADARQKFVRCLAGGIMTMGETVTDTALTYASLAAQASTYAQISQSCTYTWENDVVEVYFSTGHFLETGQQTGLDFTSGGATSYDGIYTVTVTSPYHFTVPLVGSGASGNVTSRPGIAVTFTAHAMNIGESVYCDFTSGTGVDGTYEIYAVPSANAYNIKYPSTTSITSGNVSCLHTLVVTWTAHGFTVGREFGIDFTSGSGVDGNYIIKTVATNSFNINFPHSATTSGNCTLKREMGYVAPAGCRTWIPSNILTEVATGARATNTAPNSTIASRPEWTTTSAGALDLEYVYATSGYFNVTQPYSVRIRENVFQDSTVISECATALDIDGLYHGMRGSLDNITLAISNCYAGGTVKNVRGDRGNAPGTSDHAIAITYCKGITFENVIGSIVQYARSTGYPIHVSTSSDCIFNNCGVLNGRMNLTGSPNITINNLDYCERLIGHGLAAEGAVTADANCNNLKIDNVTYGLGFTVPNQQPVRILSATGCANVKMRNLGTKANPLPLPSWGKNAYSLATIFTSGGSNNGVKIQKCFAEGVRTSPFSTTVNSDKNMLYESSRCGNWAWSTKAVLALQHADLNGTIKNCGGANGTTGQASVYGTHFVDTFLGRDYGRFIIMCNEPTVETSSVFTSVVGTPKWNSSGGVILPNVNDQHIWETPYYIKGHTGFRRSELAMSGGTLSNYNIHYQIDLGSGYSNWKNVYYTRSGASGSSGAYTFTVTDATGVSVGDYCFGTGLSNLAAGQKLATIPKVTQVNGNTITVDVANTGTVSGIIRFNQLPSETIDPSIGFKLKFRITVINANTGAITFMSMETLTSDAAQDNYYPLDTNTFTLTNLPSGVEVRIRQGSKTLVQSQSVTGGVFSFDHALAGKKIKAQMTLPGYAFEDIVWTLTDSDVSLPITYSPDPSYI